MYARTQLAVARPPKQAPIFSSFSPPHALPCHIDSSQRFPISCRRRYPSRVVLRGFPINVGHARHRRSRTEHRVRDKLSKLCATAQETAVIEASRNERLPGFTT